MLVLAGEVGFSLLAVRPLQRIGAVGVSFHAVWIAALQLAVGALLLERHALRWPTPVETGALTHMAVFVTVVAFVAWYTALQQLGADRAGLLVGTVAITALATTALVGTATITTATALGCALVVAGVATGVRTPSTTARRNPRARTTARRARHRPLAPQH
ncbi:MAG: EamA family transporter [Nitriliruptorales bacterium]|nr:EamA family transporter [Nitriliruptorales bacterium]